VYDELPTVDCNRDGAAWGGVRSSSASFLPHGRGTIGKHGLEQCRIDVDEAQSRRVAPPESFEAPTRAQTLACTFALVALCGETRRAADCAQRIVIRVVESRCCRPDVATLIRRICRKSRAGPRSIRFTVQTEGDAAHPHAVAARNTALGQRVVE
jgi:hypothetical protein